MSFALQARTRLPDELKRIVVNHLSPVLMGFKPAALFTVQAKVRASLAALLPPRLSLMVLRQGENGPLVFVFDREKLEKAIAAKSAGAVLSGLGYPAGAPVLAALTHLRKQFARDTFPHEVGLFLGYPAEDVVGFVKHSGQNYKLCGYWKVYGDVERAKLCFRQYDACRDRMKAGFAALYEGMAGTVRAMVSC
ncbi:MAG: DUF3793 family protein [Treponema sp.]|jgi:hypothetical protein|nr:DUF3793 family protein [Treponema sp.]